MSTFLLLLLLWAFTLIILVLFIFIIFKGVGFNMLFSYAKANLKRKKGFGLAWFFSNTGVSLFEVVDLNTSTFLVKRDKKEKRYNVKRECINLTANNVPVIMYPPGDADPFDPLRGLPTVTDPEVQQTTVAKLNEAEASRQGLGDWIKTNWWKIGIFVLAVLGIFGFIILDMSNRLAEVSLQAGQSVIVSNFSNLGK